jgi:glycosyltransferase involved in cell wall biosynthesis
MRNVMPTKWRRVNNVLMTCSLDEGAGGVQVVFQDLVHWLEAGGRHVHLIYQAPLARAAVFEGHNGWGRRAFFCPMPALVRDSTLIGLPLLLASLPFTLLRLTWLIRRHRIDVINCHYLAEYFIHLVLAARLTRVPLVLSVHGADVDSWVGAPWIRRTLFRLTVRGADRIVACSAALAARAAEVLPEARDRITWAHNGLDVSRHEANGDAPALRTPYVLCVSRHVYKKGIDTLLRAFQLLLRQTTHLSLVLVGDGPLFAEHKQLAEQLKIADRVAFVGEVPHMQVARFLDGCSLFVLPSREEPFGIVILEAAYHKKPIVCTRVGGVREIVTPAFDGMFVDPEDPEGLATQMAAVLNDPELAGRLGANARQTIMTRFLWNDRINDYVAIYEGSPGPLLPHLPSSTPLTTASTFGGGSLDRKHPRGKPVDDDESHRVSRIPMSGGGHPAN